MIINRLPAIAIFLLMLTASLSLRGFAQHKPKQAEKQASAITIGGEPVVQLQRPQGSDKSKPQFLEATLLPGRGMAVLQLTAFLPSRGRISLLNAPALPAAEQVLDHGDDEWGTQVFRMGGAILLPFANRIRGKLSADAKTITADVAGKQVTLPADWSGNQPGAEKHAIHGLMFRSKFQDVKTTNAAGESSVNALLDAGNFDGHWLSDTDVHVEAVLKDASFELTVTAKNVGHEPLPMGIGWHPYFVIPSGERSLVKLHLPSETRAIMNNYDDSFVTGERMLVDGTPYDFSKPGGVALGKQYLDDNYSNLLRNRDGSTVSELIDPAAKYGLRLTTLSPEIKSIQVYAPLGKNFVAIEPQFNLPDPYSKVWGQSDTGMVLLQPGESVSWKVRLDLFVPSE